MRENANPNNNPNNLEENEMADLTITAANVRVKNAATGLHRVQAGEANTHGQSVYLKASDSKWYKADADLSAEAAGSGGLGIVMVPAGAMDDYFYIAKDPGGAIDIGATLTQGEIYVLSGTPGGVCPEGDLSAGERVTIIGVGANPSTLNLLFQATGVAI